MEILFKNTKEFLSKILIKKGDKKVESTDTLIKFIIKVLEDYEEPEEITENLRKDWLAAKAVSGAFFLSNADHLVPHLLVLNDEIEILFRVLILIGIRYERMRVRNNIELEEV